MSLSQSALDCSFNQIDLNITIAQKTLTKSFMMDFQAFSIIPDSIPIDFKIYTST